MEAHPVCAEEREAGFFRVPLDGQLSRDAGAKGLKSVVYVICEVPKHKQRQG